MGSNLGNWPTSYPVPATAVANNPGVTVQKNVSTRFDAVTLSRPLSGNIRTFVRIKLTP